MQNWSFFKAQYENYEVATSLNKKQDDIRVATLLSLMGKECFRVYTHLDIAEADRKKVDKILQVSGRHFEPTRNVNRIKEKLLPSISLNYGNWRQLVSSVCSKMI